MKAQRGNIWIFLVLIIISTSLYCERVDPEDAAGEGGVFTTIPHKGLKILNPDDLIFIGTVNGEHVFEVSNASSMPGLGSVILYDNPETGNRLLGKIALLNTEGNITRLLLERPAIEDVFEYLSLAEEFTDGTQEARYLDPRVSVEGDSLFLDPLEIFWDFGEGNWGLMNLDSLKIVNKISGSFEYYLGPKWEEGVSSKKISQNYNQTYSISTKLSLVNKGGLQLKDSIKVREYNIGAFYAGPVPVQIKIREWLILNVESDQNNNLKAIIASSGVLQHKVKYQDKGAWEVNTIVNSQEDVIEDLEWDRRQSFGVSLQLKCYATPVFGNIPVLGITSKQKINIDSSVDWPDWQMSGTGNTDLNLLSDNALFNDLPAGNFFHNEPVRNILNLSGELQNNSPVAEFSINPQSGFIDTKFSFNAGNSYDIEDGTALLEVRWDFNGDEIWDTPFSTNKIAEHIFVEPGNYLVILEVKDTNGASSISGKTVNVQDISSAPTPFFTVTPENGRTSDVFTFDASGSWDREDTPAQLKVRWDFDGNGVWDTEFSTKKTEIYFFKDPGVYYAKVEVKDTQGLTSSTSLRINVEAANIKPTGFFTVSPEGGDINTTFRFDASETSDPEDPPEELRIRWDFENDGQWDTQYRTIKTINHVFPVANTYTVVMQVIDTDNFTNFFSRQIVVTNPNTKPKADFTFTPATGTVDTVFTFDARASTDAEDTIDQLLFRWDWNNDNVYDTEFSSNPLIDKKFDEPGTFIIKVQVRDSGGLESDKARLITIIE